MTWISVKDSKPISYQNVLLTDGKSTWVGYTFDNLDVYLASHPDYRREYWNGDYPAQPYTTRCEPTHWMPLPPSPNLEHIEDKLEMIKDISKSDNGT